MSNHTILVIDDSSTIRRLADSTLSRAGYSVALAPNAEEGVRCADELRPDLILLDHQLPGTTGFEVCQQLIASPELGQIPVVISSTLRKRAYVEYADLPNVVDMLPKPYTEELLVTTVENALDTGSLIVESQAQGTAVPEVIEELGEADLNGVFSGFSIREVIDFLNNGRKQGTLEVEAGHNRYWIYLEGGRVQGITATGIPSSEIIDRLPDALQELAPVLKLTVGSGNQLEGIVDLLNTNVLDPRLLRKLLRHQAAVLLTACFTQQLRAFRFDSKRKRPPLYERLPLDLSVLALLVEGSLTFDADRLPCASADTVFVRQPIRGQNLDRAGLAAQQARILGKLTAPRTLKELADDLKWDAPEVRRVLFGLELAQLVAREGEKSRRDVVLFEHDLDVADRLNNTLKSSQDYSVKVVHDATAFQLLVKRANPDAIVVDLTSSESHALVEHLKQDVSGSTCRYIAVTDEYVGSATTDKLEFFAANLPRSYTAAILIETLDRVFQDSSTNVPSVAGSISPVDPEIAPETLPSATEEPTLCPQ